MPESSHSVRISFSGQDPYDEVFDTNDDGVGETFGGSGSLLAFAQAIDDSRAVIEFIHEYAVPVEDLGTSLTKSREKGKWPFYQPEKRTRPLLRAGSTFPAKKKLASDLALSESRLEKLSA